MTHAVKLYGLKRCSTCVKAQTWLDEHGVPFEFIDYRDQPVPPDTLVQWAQAVGGWEKLINKASTTWRGLSDADKAVSTPEGYLALVIASPTLVKRPVLVMPDEQVAVGFSDKKYSEILG